MRLVYYAYAYEKVLKINDKKLRREKLKSKRELCLKIKSLNIRMIHTSNEKGMNHSLTIQTSQKLDRLINEYMKLTQKK